jgi:hypothetical protein
MMLLQNSKQRSRALALYAMCQQNHHNQLYRFQKLTIIDLEQQMITDSVLSMKIVEQFHHSPF